MRTDEVIKLSAQNFFTELFLTLKELGIDPCTLPEKKIGESLGNFAYRCYTAGLEDGMRKARAENIGLFAPFQITKDKNDPKADN